MKLIACADWHLRNKAPMMRSDDFCATIKGKVQWVVDLANSLEAKALMVAGDIFDTPQIPYDLFVEYHRIMSQLKGVFLTVYGQHDLRYHSYKHRLNTPLSAILSTIQNGKAVCEESVQVCERDVTASIFGCSWGNPLVPADQLQCDGYKILLLHRLVVEDKGLWPGHTGYVTTDDLLDLGYDVVVSGDNHQSFAKERDGRWVVNVGSLARLKTDQTTYKPRVAVLTLSDTIEVEWIHVPIESIVFKEDEGLDTPIEASDELIQFLTDLRDYKFNKPSFDNNLNSALVHIDDNSIKDMVEEVLIEAKRLIEAGGV